MHPLRGLALAVLLATCATAAPRSARHSAPDSAERKLSSALREHLDRFEAVAQTQGVTRARTQMARQTRNHPLIRTNEAGALLLSVRVAEYGAEVQAELSAAGAQIVRASARWSTVECWVMPDQVRAVAALPFVRWVRAVERPITRAGSRMTEGDAVLGGNLVRALGYDGTGVKVGVLSDGVDHMASAQASGDLPPNVVVLPGYEGEGDEGTAMLEIVHDIAPGAQLYFATAFITELAFADAILALADAGCKVIVDDVGYFAEPMFEDGPIAQAVDEVHRRGVAYFSSAGNAAQRHYQAEFARTGGARSWHAWNGIADSSMRIIVSAHGDLTAFVQWNDPFGASGNDYDLFLYRSPVLIQSNLLEVGGDPQDGTGDPYEALSYYNPFSVPDTVYLAIDLYEGLPRFLSVYVFGAVQEREYVVSEGSTWGHPCAQGAMGVGAINANEPGHDMIAPYSSWGPAEIYFPQRETRQKPDITGIDGVSVTGAGGFPSTFYGTSASAPHIAAVAALLRDAHPRWDAEEVYTALKNTAIDLGAQGWDKVYGYGLAQAQDALNEGGPTRASGTITTRTWTKQNSPYRVTGTITVPSGDTLTIEPGAEVLFDADVQFIVNGVLHAVGTPQDSIRFAAGDAAEWGGLRISDGDSSAIQYARISDGHADGASEPNNRGGGVHVAGSGTKLGLEHVVVRGNTADDTGGGIALRDGATVTLVRSVIRGNRSAYGGGGIALVADGAPASLGMRNCTVSGNTSSAGNGGALWVSGSDAVITNSILWGNSPDEVFNYPASPGSITATYSDIQGDTLWMGEGNINGDPLFVNATEGDFRLCGGSPCIDAGDPASPLDPDSTRAEMGAFYFDLPPTLALPDLEADPGDHLIIPVVATFHSIYSANLAFLIDTTVLAPDSGFVRYHAFEGYPGAELGWSVMHDTVRISLSSNGVDRITLTGETFVELAFVVNPDAERGRVAPLIWLPFHDTKLNGQAADLTNGSVTVRRIVYGDVSGSGTLTAYDVTLILRYVVRLLPVINMQVGDVTGNGRVSSFDAALVLRKIVFPDYLFPVEGGRLPKPATRTPRTLTWVSDASGLALAVDDPTGIAAGEMTLVLPGSSPVTVRGGDLIACKQAGSVLRVAFVRAGSDGPRLFRLESATPLAGAPRIVEAQFDEGEIPLAGLAHPVEFALEQNAPNPFNPTTTIRFTVPQSGPVNMTICTLTGQIVRTLVDGTVEAGAHHVLWDGRDALGREVSSGVYLYRLTSSQGTLVRRMVCVR